MSENKRLSLGQALDQIIEALESFDEKGKKTIITTVCDHFGISLGPPESHSSSTVSEDTRGESPSTGNDRANVVDIRTLKEQKNPKTAQQMACVVAFYLSEHAPANERKATIRTEDLEKYFKQGGFKLPKKLRGILPDGKDSGYFDLVGKGEYALTTVGYNLVAHSLPDRH